MSDKRRQILGPDGPDPSGGAPPRRRTPHAERPRSQSAEAVRDRPPSGALAWAQARRACRGAVEWLRSQGDITLDEAWARCERTDWLLWVLGRVHIPRAVLRSRLRLWSFDLAERALHREREEGREPDPRAIEVARQYELGQASRAELDAAGAAARVAAWAAARVGDNAASTAADDAERVAAIAAANAPAGPARPAERRWQCDRLRLYFTPEGD